MYCIFQIFFIFMSSLKVALFAIHTTNSEVKQANLSFFYFRRTHMNFFQKNIISTTVMALGLAFGSVAMAADRDMNADSNDVAIHGYDPVAYFSKGQPVQGSAEFTATYKNAIYEFSTAENRDSFRADPAKYAPQFGGHCAMGVALNKKLDVDPTAWRIVDGKLYLNLNKDVQAKWLQDVSGNLKTANHVWPKIKNTAADKL